MVIGIITNFNIQKKASAAVTVAKRLRDGGHTLLFPEYFKDKIEPIADAVKPVTYVQQDDIYKESDLLVVLGGDGSMLDCARRSYAYDVPLLGINLGHLGFLDELEMSDLSLLDRLSTGDYVLEERDMLKVTLCNNMGQPKLTVYGLNDAVVSGGNVAHIVELSLSEGGLPVANYRADGLIVSSPTGSSAYSLSAGGALVSPDLACLCVTPVCSHVMGARPMIFAPDKTLEITNVCRRDEKLFLTVDGRMNYDLYHNQIVRITLGEKKVKLLHFARGTWYERIRRKLMISGEGEV